MMEKLKKKAKIALEDGTVFEGISFGMPGEKTGEIIFNTGMTGYQEVLTDPSYKGQIVTMTYPLIGNYGINEEDFESAKIQVEGFVVKEYSHIDSNWRSQKKLDEFLKEHKIMGIEDIDTRALTKHIRVKGALKACISTEDLNDESLIKKAKDSPGLIGRDLVKEVTCKESYDWNKEGEYKIVVVDCGVKYNILRELVACHCQVKVVPARTTAQEILASQPDGILLSNGPGDPAPLTYLVKTVKELIDYKLSTKNYKLSIMGICLGHQILGMTFGGKTYKLKFGHHGLNHPVKELESGKIMITVQNHGFCVDIDSLKDADIEITHINLNDNTLEGMRHKKLPVFSVQFHPEAGPGPNDAKYLFKEFIQMIKDFKS